MLKISKGNGILLKPVLFCVSPKNPLTKLNQTVCREHYNYMKGFLS